MKAFILGDIHLGRGISIGKPAELGKLNSRVQDQVDLLEWAYNLCVQDPEIRTIVITGDVYQDYRPHPAIISIFMRWLKKCEHLGVQVHIVMGNHDILRSGQYVVSALDLVSELELPQANVYKKPTRLELDDFTLVLVPFRDKRMYEVKETEEALEKLNKELEPVLQPSSKTKVCIGHLALEGSIPVGDEIIDQLNELFVPIEMFKFFDYVWMGHIHNPHVVQESNPYAAHIGSLDRSDFHKKEIENNKVAILLDSKLPEKYREIIIPTRKLVPLKIEVPSGKDSTEYVINELCLASKKNSFKDSIIRLEVQLNGSELENIDREKVSLYLRDNLEINHLCGFSESRIISNIQINPEDSFDSTMEIQQVIKKWAETRDFFENDDEREEFKKAAQEVYQQYQEKYL